MRDNLIIDCFAGGGGASVGIEMALGRQVDIAINHDPDAILMHRTNHPDTLHLTEDIFKADLKKYVKGRHVALMWASPDCTSHSKAKGGKPRKRGLRILPWAVYKHAKIILPDVIIMENVQEIQQWGPLDDKGYPIPERKGEDYKKFITAMKSLGYVFDSRELVAADYGAPTTRKRWYAIFRRDSKDIVWPEQTHSKGVATGLKPWEPIYNYLDLWDLGKSIFGRKKPLAENTMKRIARGLEKFVFNNPEPFIMKCYGGNYQGAGTSVEEPLHTITMVDHNALVTPYIVPIGYGEKSGQKPRVNGVNEPVGTIVASGTKHYLCNPVIAPYMFRNNTGAPGSDIKEPMLTITTGGHHGVISPLLIQYHSETTASGVRGQEVDEPIQTIDTSNRYGLVMSYMTKFYKSGTGQSLEEPIHTITTSPGHFGTVSVLTVDWAELQAAGIDEDTARKCTWVSQFILEYYGSGTGQGLDEPLRTVVTKDRFALLTILGSEYVIFDIFLRILKPEELKLGQGFPKDYVIDRDYLGHPYPVSKQVARIGNSVVPIMAQKLVEANCGYLKVGERQPIIQVKDFKAEESGQMRFA